jgi:hypothetical protein
MVIFLPRESGGLPEVFQEWLMAAFPEERGPVSFLVMEAGVSVRKGKRWRNCRRGIVIKTGTIVWVVDLEASVAGWHKYGTSHFTAQ